MSCDSLTPEISSQALASPNTIALTAEEEEMICDLTKALEDSLLDYKNNVTNTSEHQINAENALSKALNLSSAQISSFENVSSNRNGATIDIPTTPEILGDILDFEDRLSPFHDSSELLDFLPSDNPSSPITKEQILDMLQDTPVVKTDSLSGSESGYDSPYSPLSHASSSEAFYFENDEFFAELFPSLI